MRECGRMWVDHGRHREFGWRGDKLSHLFLKGQQWPLSGEKTHEEMGVLTQNGSWAIS